MSSDSYVKASRYDLKGQKHNFNVFNGKMKSKPWIPILIGFLTLLMALNLILNANLKSLWNSPVKPIVLGLIVLIVGVYFLYLGFTSFRRIDNSDNL